MDPSKDSENQLDVVIKTFLDTAGDKEAIVRDSVSNALQNLSQIHTNVVANAVLNFRFQNHKIPTSQLMVVLSVLEYISQRQVDSMSSDVIEKLVEYSVDEMTRPESPAQVQSIASTILIALGNKHCNEVLTCLIPQLVPGSEPHPCVVSTLGHLAGTNVNQFVAIIKLALDIMIPMMPEARSQEIKVAFSFAIGKFSEAILEFISGADKEKDAPVTMETFSQELSKAYDVIATSWILAKEIKVTESSIKALSPLFCLLPEEKLMVCTPKAVVCLVNAYKRPCLPHHIVTSTLASLIAAAPPAALQLQLEPLLNTLASMVVVPPDYTLPDTVKQHSEVLRCYYHISVKFTDRLADVLIKHLRMGSEREKVEALVVCSHLVTAQENYLKGRMVELLSAIRCLLSDPSLRVKKTLVKTISSLAVKGYADDSSDFIEFLVRQCSSISNPMHGLEMTDLVSICESTLHLLSSTVCSLDQMMWDTLLKLFCDPLYDPAVPVIAKALSTIAPKLDNKFKDVSGDGTGRVKSEQVLSRAFYLLGSPLNTNRGPSILSFLQHYSLYVSPHITDLWSHKLPQLINYLQVSEWSDKEWDALLTEFMYNTISTIGCHDSNWPVEMAFHLSTILAQCSSFGSGVSPGTPTSVDEGILVVLCALAQATAVIEDKATVARHLDTIITKLQDPLIDTKGVARSVGILSTAHLDLVLTRLELIAQTELNRRNSRLLGLMKDTKADAEMEKCRYALLQCYASIAQRCPLMELLPKLDSFTQWIMSQIVAAKDSAGREAALEAIYNCAETLVRHKTETKHGIKARSQILDVVMKHLQSNKPDPISLKVTAALVKLPPSLVAEARLHILKTCFDSVLSLEASQSSHDTQTLKHLGELVEELLLDSVTPDRLDEVSTVLEQWIRSRNPQHRFAALITLRTALLAYYQNMQPNYQNPSGLGQCGDLLGMIIVRCFDSSAKVNRVALQSAGLVLGIVGVYEGRSHDPSTEQIFLDLPDVNTSFHLTKILVKSLPQTQLHKLIGRLLDGLTDVDVTACSNASDILASVFTLKGPELFHYINDILGSLLLQLTSSAGHHSTNGVGAVIALAKHHPKVVINILLKQPLPLHSSISDCWKNLAHDPDIGSFALDHLLCIMTKSALFDDSSNQPNRPKIAALQVLSAVSALSEMATATGISDSIRECLPILFPSLLTLLAAYIGASPPVLTSSPTKASAISVVTNRDAFKIIPPRVVKECLQRVLICIGSDDAQFSMVLTSLLSATSVQSTDSLLQALPQLTLCLIQRFPLLLPKLLSAFSDYVGSEIEAQRVIIAGFFSECLAIAGNSSSLEATLADTLISNLLSAAADPYHSVRSIAMKGLNYVSHLPEHQRKHHEEKVLSCLIQGLDDSEGSLHTRIPLEAMRSLSVLVKVLDQESLSRVQLSVGLRLKTFFEKEEILLRSVSLRLFGQLSGGKKTVIKNTGGMKGESGYVEQVRSVLCCLILHLSEPEPEVVKACKFTLRETSHLLEAEKMRAMLNDHLIDNGTLQYEQFITALSKIMVDELGDLSVNMISVCISYSKSNWPSVRGNAALLLGLLYKHLSSEQRGSVSREQLVTRLLQMTSDHNRDVRAKSIQSLGILMQSSN